jgi:hypothetical protein
MSTKQPDTLYETRGAAKARSPRVVVVSFSIAHADTSAAACEPSHAC